MKTLTAIALVIFGISSLANAQVRRPPPEFSNLEQRVQYLEDSIRRHEFRLNQIEKGGYQPPSDEGVACIVVDSGYNKVFLGKGRTNLQAETEARQNCGKGVHPSYCSSAVRCDDGKGNPRARGYYCVVKDSGYGKVFSGEADNIIEAEYNAKFACQSAVNATYCGKVTATCEAVQ